ncbi:Acyl-CoA thioesterase FadM [Streptomyces sp. TLI_053]|uniref:acyl-CoA thioesterase n=1 Tax=Streptomyces sp. TLI_053 TaxID=1855352 RepID=UPI00087C490E|nr:hypothetical protein [Streptomyces sp. TLI_053]SDT83299.1 Acyl-CoA thioesterase FadM [Streptomyces sp. TLI_053]
MHADGLTPRYGRILPPHEPGGPFWYAIDHVVTYGETGMAGPVYYLRLIEWQGRLRELFGLDLTPDYITAVSAGRKLYMSTQAVSGEFLKLIRAGDVLSLQMALPWAQGHRLMGEYAFYRPTRDGQELVARGEQIWTNTDFQGTPVPWPTDVLDILRRMNTDISRALTH